MLEVFELGCCLCPFGVTFGVFYLDDEMIKSSMSSSLSCYLLRDPVENRPCNAITKRGPQTAAL